MGGNGERKVEWWLVGAKSWGEGVTGSPCVMGTEFQLGKMERVLDMEGGDGGTTMRMYLLLKYLVLNCTLRKWLGK